MAERERRRYTRFQVPLKISVKGLGLDEVCLTNEVGLGGCGVTLSKRLVEGALVQVELSSARIRDSLTGTAQVVWTSPGTPWRTGLAFSQPLMEAAGPFLRALVGTVQLATESGA